MASKILSSRKRRLGDRYDGYKVRSKDPFFGIIPHIMNARHDSQVHFEERIEITEIERFVRRLRRETDMKDVGLLHVIMAASVRMFSRQPALNRFIIGRRIYSRNSLEFSLAVKKTMTFDGMETTIKPEFEPDDTLHDVWEKVQKQVLDNKIEDSSNNTDDLAKKLSYIPNFIIKWIVGIIRILDSVGLLPKAIKNISPFHTSMFITDMGSTGISAVYHHLYDFGTCSIFMCIGKKETILKKQLDGTIKEVKTVNIRFVVDERTNDGYYFAMSIRNFRKILRNPEQLLEKPEKVFMDPGISLIDK